MRAIVTGGCGFIGSALVRRMVDDDHHVLNIDSLTYGSNPRNVASCIGRTNYHFMQADICDGWAMKHAFGAFKPDTVFHLAAESHVDRSIKAPDRFIETNVGGTFRVLEAARECWSGWKGPNEQPLMFIHVSTDEVFGSAGPDEFFTETSPIKPNSPYSAAKAGAEHLVSAWRHTYGVPAVIANFCNVYGPYQHRDKFIPIIIGSWLRADPVPIHGDGQHVRDWLYVYDAIDGLLAIRDRADPLEPRYCFGGVHQERNVDIASRVLLLIQARRNDGRRASPSLWYVPDRPGNDRRYATDSSKARNLLGWGPKTDFRQALDFTVEWYLGHQEWLQRTSD